MSNYTDGFDCQTAQVLMWTHMEWGASNRGERPTQIGNKNTSTTAMVIPCGNYQTIL